MPLYHAPAKINLTLHVTGKREDGYHLLDSLTVFARDVYDTLEVSAAENLSLNISGPFASGLQPDHSNLVIKAAERLAHLSGHKPLANIHLVKNIPMGAGLGGGSADAAACVRALESLWDVAPDQQAKDDLLLGLGADVPVCYRGTPARVEGIGEKLSDAPDLPPFHLLLVWPGEHAATQKIFNARTNGFSRAPALPVSFSGMEDFIAYLASGTNDLTQAAESLCPSIGHALRILPSQNGCLMSRMSGSGSCVFGIFADAGLCQAASKAVQAENPLWWVKTTAV